MEVSVTPCSPKQEDAKKVNSENPSERVARIVPRRKNGKSVHPLKRTAVTLTRQDIISLFHLRQGDAAGYLGISLTALKTACRQLGLQKWPSGKWLPSDFDEHVETSLGAQKDTTPEESCLDDNCMQSNHCEVQPQPAICSLKCVMDDKNSCWPSGERKVLGLSTALLLDEALCHVQSSFPLHAKPSFL
uniref:RWP-RK domain-containing protein n=1 Tax=Hanusia phi TaxID=3032 RepID=A0A7S0EAY4_9CRYP|mmetsp:Transcript_19587/g.44808  ORF Transcript_19587/g.44808 Transcript_19587/m.44808 type:complete len:189 (+) Transcript_19587:199-765(+)